jgi:RNA processing factor Prp31
LKEQLTEITKDDEVAQSIIEAAKNSMGQDVTEADKVTTLCKL